MHRVQHLHEDGLLGREVVIDGALGDTGGSGDVVDAGRLEPALREQHACAGEDSADGGGAAFGLARHAALTIARLTNLLSVGNLPTSGT
jgi:hypothetical protein